LAESTGIVAILEKLSQMDAKLNLIQDVANRVSAIESDLAALKTETGRRHDAVRPEIDQLWNKLFEEKKRLEQLKGKINSKI
jgi:predicted RNase H-like nuclease (RuvC/YqgF family)